MTPVLIIYKAASGDWVAAFCAGGGQDVIPFECGLKSQDAALCAAQLYRMKLAQVPIRVELGPSAQEPGGDE